MTPGATRQLAKWVASTPVEELPAEVLERARYFILDYVGAALAGARIDSSGALAAFVDGFAPGAATVIGRTRGAQPAYAALCNGVAAHGTELDDTHQEGSIHLGAPVISAAIAASEIEPATGRDFLGVVVLGYEVAARVAMAADPAALYARGFHPTAVCAPFGAAAAVARLWKLDAATIAHAFGIAASQAAGLMAFLATGAWTKRLHAGWAAQSGLVAAGLARQGFTGPDTVLEAPGGFLAAYSSAPRPERLTEGLGRAFEILATSVKPHACCRYMQAPIDAILDLATRHAVAATDVARVTLGILDTAFPIICEPAAVKTAPRTVVDAQFSMPFGAAVALLFRRASLAEFTPETLASPRVRALMPRVACVHDPELDRRFPREWPAWARIELADGRTLAAAVSCPKGDPRNPLTWAELIAKYRGLAGGVLPPAALEAVEARVRTLDAEPDASAVWRLLRAGSD